MGNEFGHPEWIDFPREGNGWSFHYCRRQWSLKNNTELKYEYLNNFDHDMIHLAKDHHIFNQRMANLQLMKAPEQMLCFARCDLFFAFNFHPSNSLTNVLVPVYPDSEEFTVEFTTDDWRYGGFGQIAHQTYPVKEFDGQRYVELYIPARTAIVLREVKEEPKPAKKSSSRKTAAKAEGEKKTTRRTKKTEAPAETAEAPVKKPRARKTTKKVEE